MFLQQLASAGVFINKMELNILDLCLSALRSIYKLESIAVPLTINYDHNETVLFVCKV